MNGSVVALDEEEAAGIEAGGDAGEAWVFADADAHPLDPGGSGGEAGEGVRVGTFELVKLVVEVAEDGGEEGFAGVEAAGGESERGGEFGQGWREGCVSYVEADTDDGVAEGFSRGGGGGFNEDSSELFAVEEKIVRPAKVGFAAGEFRDGCLDGEAGGEGEMEGSGGREGGAKEDGEIKTCAGLGVPGVAAASTPGGLLIGDPDMAFGEAGLGGLEGEGAGGGDGGEMVDVAEARVGGAGGYDPGVPGGSVRRLGLGECGSSKQGIPQGLKPNDVA